MWTSLRQPGVPICPCLVHHRFLYPPVRGRSVIDRVGRLTEACVGFPRARACARSRWSCARRPKRRLTESPRPPAARPPTARCHDRRSNPRSPKSSWSRLRREDAGALQGSWLDLPYAMRQFRAVGDPDRASRPAPTSSGGRAGDRPRVPGSRRSSFHAGGVDPVREARSAQDETLGQDLQQRELSQCIWEVKPRSLECASVLSPESTP